MNKGRYRLVFSAEKGAYVPVPEETKACGKGGGRSAEGANILNRLGHPDALWLEGGTTGWLAQNT